MKELFRGVSFQKPKLVLWSNKNNRRLATKGLESARSNGSFRAWHEILGVFSVIREIHKWSWKLWLVKGSRAKLLGDERVKTDAGQVEQPWCGDGLHLSTVHCLFPAAYRVMKDYCWVFGVNPLMAQSIPQVKASHTASSQNTVYTVLQETDLINYRNSFLNLQTRKNEEKKLLLKQT